MRARASVGRAVGVAVSAVAVAAVAFAALVSSAGGESADLAVESGHADPVQEADAVQEADLVHEKGAGAATSRQPEPAWPDGAPPWGAAGQEAWQSATGLEPAQIGDVFGVMRSADVARVAAEDPFGTVPVYAWSGGAAGEQIGVWTQAGSFSTAEAAAPGFDVRALMGEYLGEEELDHLERAGELTCEESMAWFEREMGVSSNAACG